MLERLQAGICLLLVIMFRASGTVLIPLSDQALYDRAECVVVGQVISSREVRTDRVLTITTVASFDVLKGERRPAYEIARDIGTTRDGKLRVVLQEVCMEIGEVVLLFLRAEPGGYYRTVGRATGKYELVAVGGEVYCEKDFSTFSWRRAGRRKGRSTFDGLPARAKSRRMEVSDRSRGAPAKSGSKAPDRSKSRRKRGPGHAELDTAQGAAKVLDTRSFPFIDEERMARLLDRVRRGYKP